jgi:hypothetical protein
MRANGARMVAALAAALLMSAAATACSGASKAKTPAKRTTTTLATTTTVTTLAPSTTAASSPTSTPPDPNGAAVGADGAQLQAPATPPAPIALPADCHQLATPGMTVDCARGSGATADLLWVVRHGPGPGAGADIYRVTGAQASLVLTANDADGSSWSGVAAFTAAIGGPDGADVVVAYRLQGTGAQLQVDVVGAGAQVLFHRELDQGRLDVSAGVYRDWAAEFGPDDANCCPSQFAADTVDFVGGAWRVGHHADIAPNAVPAGQVP